MDVSGGAESDIEAESDAENGFIIPVPKTNPFDRRPDGHLPTIQERESAQDDCEDSWVPPWRTILGLDSSLLADILTPQMSDNKFEMWIDNLVFLGYPVQLNANISRDYGSTQTRDRHPDYVPKQDRSAPEDVTSDKRSPLHHDEAIAEFTETLMMTTFHLVFALDASIDEKYHKHITDLLAHAVRPMTSALVHEQNTSNYVWKQCELMRDIRRRGEKNRTNISTLWHDILSKSDLAEVIKQAFDAISNDDVAHLLINRKHALDVLIPRNMTSDSIPVDTISEHPFLNSAISFGISMDEADPLILPYYALLLLDEPERILATLPASSAAPVERLLHEIRPQRDFHELARLLNVSVQAVMNIAQDLIRWRCALPIPPLHERNTYTISPTANKSRLPQQIPLFARAFPEGPSLPEMLAILSLNAAPYASLIPEGRLIVYMDMLAWLMRAGWIIQLRTFVSIKVRAEIKAAVAKEQVVQSSLLVEDTLESDLTKSGRFDDSIMADPYNATEQETMWLRKIASYHPVADAALFLRACKYLNGKHAVEKIAVREGIDPRSLRRVLEVFDEDLIKSYSW